MREHRNQHLTSSRRTAPAAALAAVALLAAGGCESDPRCGNLDSKDPTFIGLEEDQNLIPAGREQVEVVLSVNGRELWRSTVRRHERKTSPDVEIVYPPSDLPRAANFTYVLEAAGKKYTFAGPDPLCRYVRIDCAAADGVRLWSPDYRPVYLNP